MNHEEWMDRAILEAEKARGTTGDNPWVGCAIVGADDTLVSVGHTQGPGEDHAEIVAMHVASAHGHDLSAVILYSTLEPCAFHGRTPACAHAIIAAGVRRVVIGILDPNPRVDGEGIRILERAGVEVVPFVCEKAISRQLAPWIFRYHPHDPIRRFRELRKSHDESTAMLQLCEHFGIDEATARETALRATVNV